MRNEWIWMMPMRFCLLWFLKETLNEKPADSDHEIIRVVFVLFGNHLSVYFGCCFVIQ